MADYQLPFSLVVDAQTMQDADDSQSFNLNVPDEEDLVKKGKNKYGPWAQWTEKLTVSESEVVYIAPGVNRKGQPTPARLGFKVKFVVSPDTLSQKNIGRSVSNTWLTNPVEINNKQSKERVMTLMSLGKLNALLRAAGFDITPSTPGEQIDVAPYFMAPEEGGDPPVVGAQVFADFKKHVDDEGNDRVEIQAFDSLDSEGA